MVHPLCETASIYRRGVYRCTGCTGRKAGPLMPPKKKAPAAPSTRIRWTGFAQRHPTKSTCRSCGAAILAGIHDGFDIQLNPTPLTPIGEVEQLLLGHTTYELTDDSLGRRTTSRIRRGPPWIGDLVTEHHCGQTIRPEHIKHPPPKKPRRPPGHQADLFDTTEYAEDEQCPF